MVFDSQSTQAPSLMTGTRALGLSARNSGVSVDRCPEPHCCSSYGSSSSSHSHKTLRTLMEVDFPRICSMKACAVPVYLPLRRLPAVTYPLLHPQPRNRPPMIIRQPDRFVPNSQRVAARPHPLAQELGIACGAGPSIHC